MDRRRELRVLTAQEQQAVNDRFRCMAVILAKETGIVLARNKFVDATIAELCDEVPDKMMLLTAWAAWVTSSGNKLKNVNWPVSQFQTALPGALAAAEDNVARWYKFKKVTQFYDEDPILIVFRALGDNGGAR
jgi:hypothetical protein